MGVTVFTGASTGFALFYRLLYVLGLTTILSFVWNWLSVQSLDVTIDRRTRRARVGDNIEERITVRNLSALPKATLEVEDLTDLPGYSAGMATSLASKGFRSWRTLTPARKRGVYTMGPVRVANTDPFGLFRRERLFGGTDTLTIYPRTFDVSGFTIPAAYLSGDSSARKRSHDLTPHASSVRDYAFGDSISRVHWNSTARLGKLMSKQFDLGLSSDVWLLVDLHRDVQAGELEESTDEYAVSIAASLARKYLEGQLPVGLIAYGEQRYFLPAEPGAGQFDRVMDFLAMSKAEGLAPLETVLPREESLWGYHSSLIVITPSQRYDWVLALRELVKRRVRVAVVLVDGASFGGFFKTTEVVPELYKAGIPPYVVKKGDNLPVALSHVFTSPELGVAELEKTEVRL
jgi:uncharacterized protein (DUF58 family)